MRTRKSGPLEGLRVVVLPWHMSAKVAGMLLADNGATVVELTNEDVEPEPGWELAEAVWQRGKDIVPFEGKEQLARLVADTDVFISDYHNSELAELGADPDDLSAKYPKLICLQISGYGRDSAREKDPWSEVLVWAHLGFYQRQAGTREGPKMPTFPAGSYAAAFNSMTAILTALHVRSTTGKGQVAETSIADGLASQQGMMWYWSELDSAPDTPINISKGGMGRLVLESYLCADAEWVHVHSGSKGGFSRLMALAGLQEQIPPIPTDAASEIGQPIEPWQIELIHETLPVMFAGKTRAEWLKVLRDLDIPVMPDLVPGEIYADPQVLENQLSTLIELPSGETVRAGGAVVKFSETVSSPAIIAQRKVSTDEALADLKMALARTPAVREGKGDPSAQFPLKGFKVVDFGVFFAGPFASRLLADLGADVIKIENLAGCPMRPVSGGRYFNAANHHKRTLALNLKKPRSRAIIEKLVKWADVVQHNLRPGVAESLGMGYEDLRDMKPGLIYCHSPAFGSLGPYRGYPGFEPLSSAVTGLMMRHANCKYVGPYYAIGSMDPGNGLLGAASIMMALYHRDRTGEGQFIECPQTGSAILSTLDTVMREDGTIQDPLAVDEDQYGFSWWSRLYQCREGWLVTHAWSAPARKALLETTGANEASAIEDISSWAAQLSADEAVAKLRKGGVPVEKIGRPYKGDNYFFDEENVRLNRVIEFTNHPRWGRYRDLGQFWRFSASPLRLPKDGHFVPEIGAFSRQILSEHGFDAAEIDQLIAQRVVGVPQERERSRDERELAAT